MWYFRFEGLFAPDAEEFAGEGVFSSYIVLLSRRLDAEIAFHKALYAAKIDLKEILESFSVVPDQLDPEDERNLLWIRWCDKAKKSGKVEFDVWHLWDSSEDE